MGAPRPRGRRRGEDWTEDEDAKLRPMWLDLSISTEAIAQHFPGRSRYAIVGRAHRLDLPARESPIKPRTEPKPVKPKRLAPGASTLPMLGSLM